MDDFTAVAPINGYGSYLPDEIIARTDLSAEAKILCHELDKYRNGDPRSERYLQCNPGHFTLQEKCGFRSKRQVEQIVRELVDKDLVEVQPGQKAKYVLSWPTPAEQEQRQRAELEAKREEIRAEVERREKEEMERQELAEIKAREERAARFEKYKALYPVPVEAVIAGDEKAKDWVIDGEYLQDYFESLGEAKYQRAIELREKPQLDEDAEKLRRRTVREKCQRVEKDHDEKREEIHYDYESEEKWRKELEKLETEREKWLEEYRWEMNFQKKMKQPKI